MSPAGNQANAVEARWRGPDRAWSTIWVYLLVELTGGIAAGLAFRALNPGDK
jgi:glycerol uptake facilitator-like aquaporin